MTDDFRWDFPYPSQRMPVLAKNAVATSQPLAAQAGLRMLLRGGNAVDAALAAAIALTVVEPTSNGIGSDAFAILWDGQHLHGLNASGRSPRRLTADRFADRESMPDRGWDPVTVPGAVSAWVALSERFGKLPFADLFGPAIDYARHGFLVSPITAAAWNHATHIFKGFPEFWATFLPGGRAPAAGELFRCPDQAETLEQIAATKGESFYRGDLAEKIAAHAEATGGLLRGDDLADHQADWVEPLSIDYRGLTLHEIPPNGQGLAALITLGILSQSGLHDQTPDSADALHLQIEAMKLAFADAHRYISDPASADIEPQQLLDPGYLAHRAALIDMDTARAPLFGRPPGSDTVYLTAADAEGMMVSFIQSNFAGFGSGVVVPETGISLQNRGRGFTLEQGHPNQVAGGKRPYHTIIPGFVTRNEAPLLSFGVMGGHMQPQGHTQMVIRLAAYGQNPQAAIDAPRWRVNGGLDVSIEDGFASGVLADLERRGHQVQRFSAPYYGHGMGGAQLIYRLPDGYVAASESRKDGQAVGY